MMSKAMIRKIMYVAVAATLFMLTLSSASAQQRRQVMLDKVVAVVGGSAILHSELVEYAEALVSHVSRSKQEMMPVGIFSAALAKGILQANIKHSTRHNTLITCFFIDRSP